LKIAIVTDVEHCLDGSSVKDLTFDTPVDGEFITRLKDLGSLQYYSDFPRPFYTLTVPGAFSLRGVQGSPAVRMIISGDVEHALRIFSAFLATPAKG